MAEYTPVAQGNLNTVLGAIGTAGTLMPGLFSNLFGGGMNQAAAGPACSENTFITRYEANLMQTIANKETENSLLKSEVYTDGKLVEIVKDYTSQINDLAAEVRSNKDAQNAINMQQAVYNGTATATVNCIQNQVNQLMGLTKLVVPNTSVCPGWGNVNITPATTTTTTTPAG